MADSKITQLTALTTVDGSDVLPVVDVSTSTTKKVTKDNLFKDVNMTGNSVLNIYTNGISSLGVGYEALDARTTGAGNTALGTYTLTDLTTGNYNLAAGYLSGKDITTGNYNVALGGLGVLGVCTTGSGNTAVGGYSSLGAVTTGTYNIGIGYFAGRYFQQGDYNILIGYDAGNNFTGASTADNNIVIGKQAQTTSSTSSNEIIIGNTSNDYFSIPGVGFTIDDGKVGIGVTTVDTALDTKLHVAGAIRTDTGSAAANPAIVFDHDNFGDADANYIMLDRTSEAMRFNVNALERMRILPGGRVAIGLTDPGGQLHIQSDEGDSVRLYLTDGDATGVTNSLLISKDGSVSYVTDRQAGSSLSFGTADTERMRITSSGVVRPGADNTQTLGLASYRWSVVYAGTGTINTSDEREKQQIADLDDAERRVAVAFKGLVKKFTYNDAVAAKGDDARIHVGVIAQEVIAAFAAEGLDATRYALLCHDTWEAEPEETDDEGNVINPGIEAGERYGIRYDELLAFMIAAL